MEKRIDNMNGNMKLERQRPKRRDLISMGRRAPNCSSHLKDPVFLCNSLRLITTLYSSGSSEALWVKNLQAPLLLRPDSRATRLGTQKSYLRPRPRSTHRKHRFSKDFHGPSISGAVFSKCLLLGQLVFAWILGQFGS